MSEDKNNKPDGDELHNPGNKKSMSASPKKRRKSLKNPDISELDNDESDDSDKVKLKRQRNKEKRAELDQLQNEWDEHKTNEFSVSSLKLTKFRKSARLLFAIHWKIYMKRAKFYRSDIVHTKLGIEFYDEFSKKFDNSDQQQPITLLANPNDFNETIRNIFLTCGKNDLTLGDNPIPINPLSYMVFSALKDFKSVNEVGLLKFIDLKQAAKGQISFRFKNANILGRISIHLNLQPGMFWKSEIFPNFINKISETCPSVASIKVQAQKYFGYSDTIILYLNTDPEKAWEKLESIIEENIPDIYRPKTIIPFTRRKIKGVSLNYSLDYVHPKSNKKVKNNSFITLIGWISRDAFKNYLSKHSKLLFSKNPSTQLMNEMGREYADFLGHEILRNHGNVELDGTLIPKKE